MQKMIFNIARICAAYLLVSIAISSRIYGAAAAALVPEIDPRLGGTTVALLVGCYLVAVSRFRRK